MEPILYWYPIVYLDQDYPEDSVIVQGRGRIISYQLDHEPYEADVDAGGYSFHLIFGHQTSGMFLCMPDQGVGCQLSELSDRDYNMNSLLKTDRADYEDTTAIVWALYNIGSLLRFIH